MVLRAVDPHDENYGIMRERRAREARIDALSVDRSRFALMPLPRWSADAARFEPHLAATRAEQTETDRRRAWAEMRLMGRSTSMRRLG